MKSLILYSIVAVLAVGLGYFGLSVISSERSDQSAALETMLAEIRRHQQTWESRRPDRFRYVVEHTSGYGPSPRKIVVTVDGDSRTYRFRETDNLWLDAIPDSPIFIEDIFEHAESALTSSVEDTPRIRIEIDDQYGFPVFAQIGWDCSDCGDQFTISDFAVIE